MGGNESNEKSRNSIPNAENPFSVKPLKDFELKEELKFAYLWYDPRVFQPQLASKREELLREGMDVEVVSDIGTLNKKMNEIDRNINIKVICGPKFADRQYKKVNIEPRIIDIFIFYNQESEQQKLIGLKEKYGKIKFFTSDINALKVAIKQGEQFDRSVLKKDLLLMSSDNKDLLNQYRLNYHCLTGYLNKEEAKNNYLQFINKFYDKKYGTNFEASYSINIQNQKERVEQTLKYLAHQPLFWESTQDLPKSSVEPLKLAYLRLPIKDIHEAIKYKYRTIKEYVKKSQIENVFMMTHLSDQVLEKLDSYIGSFIAFTSFAQASTDNTIIKCSVKRKGDKCDRGQKYMLSIRLCQTNLEEEYDYGYWVDTELERIDEDNVIFNIYNLFQIESINREEKTIFLKYGSLGNIFWKKRNNIHLNQNEEDLFLNYNYLENEKKQISSQTSLLMKFNTFVEGDSDDKESIRKTIGLRSSQAVENDLHNLEMGKFYELNKDYLKAQECYKKVSKNQNIIHLAKLYRNNNEDEKYKKVQEELQKISENLKKNNLVGQRLKCMNQIASGMIKRNKINEAIQLLEQNQQYAVDNDNKNGYILITDSGVHQTWLLLSDCYERGGEKEKGLGVEKKLKDAVRICKGSKDQVIINFQRRQIEKDQKREELEKAEKVILYQEQSEIEVRESGTLFESQNNYDL